MEKKEGGLLLNKKALLQVWYFECQLAAVFLRSIEVVEVEYDDATENSKGRQFYSH